MLSWKQQDDRVQQFGTIRYPERRSHAAEEARSDAGNVRARQGTAWVGRLFRRL